MADKKNKMKKYLFLLSFLFVGCNPPDTPSEIKAYNEKHSVLYFKDSKSHLCFAAVSARTYGGYRPFSITCVPCDSVKNLLQSYDTVKIKLEIQ
jgi:hypothetical protein